MEGKDLLKSRSFIGLVILLLSVGAHLLGVPFDSEGALGVLLKFAEYAGPIVGALLGLLGIVGRSKPITSVLGLPIK